MQLQCANRLLDLTHPVIMGVLNITPDSFSDGGSYFSGAKPDLDLALSRVDTMLEEGAAIIDVGGESTRPGAAKVSAGEEMDRVMPVVEAISARFDTIVSVDTSSPSVITASASAGAGLINDIRALQREGALAAAAATGLPVCLMHMQGQPGTMQADPHYTDVVDEVKTFLQARLAACRKAGIAPGRILLDPGFGFGKNLDHNLELLRRLDQLEALECPLLVGLSRKSMLGQLLGRPVDQRLAGSLALALLAAQRGARIIRVHDVAATRDALQILRGVGHNPRLTDQR